MTTDKLTLEKLRVSERLESLEKTLNDIKVVLFGEKGEDGIVQELREIKGIFKVVETVLWKCFIGICGIVGLGTLPYLTDFINKVVHKQ